MSSVITPQRKGSPDNFQTPGYAVSPLLDYISNDKVIWECACGFGNIARYFQQKNYKVVTSDSDPSIVADKIFDFINSPLELAKTIFNFDVIVTNPPYKTKDKFLKRCYEIGKPFALLMPLTGLESIERQRLYKEYGLELLIPDKRINFETPTGKKEGTGSNAWFASAWFCNRLIGADFTSIKFVTIDKDK